MFDRLVQGWRPRADPAQAPRPVVHDEALRLIEQGNAEEDAGRIEAAMQRYDAAISLAPELARAHLNRGNALLALGDAERALEAYTIALQKDASYASAHFNSGNALAQLARQEAAVAAYRRAIALTPDFADAEVALGNALEDLGRSEEALASYRRATQLRPDFAEAYYNAAVPLNRLGRPEEALASLRRAIELRPDYVEAHTNLGKVQEELLDLTGAAASYRRALAINPDLPLVHSNLLLCLSHDGAIDPRAFFSEHRRFGERFEGPLRAHWPRHSNVRDPARALQVGFVSGDLRDHAVAHFMEPILQCLTRSPQLTLHAYYNHATQGRATPRLRSYMKHWHSIAHLSDSALAREIVADGIDILVDLSGHTSENRLLTFARKPAPVQASWIGYPGTTGMQAMDYYIADAHFLPPGQFDSQFTEKLVHLPANAPFLPDEAAPTPNELPALTRGFVTFGSFNRASKITPSVVALWSRVLREVPNSRMLLGAMPQDGEHPRIVHMFEAEGISRDRLTFHSRCDLPRYLSLHHEVDLCLDTFPYTGGTTTNHALWMGVPTLTLAGQTAPSRQGAAILGHVGMTDFVAHDPDEFVKTGLRWSNALEALALLRAGLRERYNDSAMRRPDLIAIGFERALRIMWERWCAGSAAAPIDVSNVAGPPSNSRYRLR